MPPPGFHQSAGKQGAHGRAQPTLETGWQPSQARNWLHHISPGLCLTRMCSALSGYYKTLLTLINHSCEMSHSLHNYQLYLYITVCRSSLVNMCIMCQWEYVLKVTCCSLCVLPHRVVAFKETSFFFLVIFRVYSVEIWKWKKFLNCVTHLNYYSTCSSFLHCHYASVYKYVVHFLGEGRLCGSRQQLCQGQGQGSSLLICQWRKTQEYWDICT